MMVLLAIAGAGCDGGAGDGGDGLASLVRLDAEPEGESCANGGTAIHSGLDRDGDGVLADAEITQSSYVCSGIPGSESEATLVRLADEPAGEHCATGGTAIHSGSDVDGDAELDDAEIASTSYVCNGGGGGEGDASLVRLDAEAAGTNCEHGGTAIRTGLDADESGALDDAEITSTTYVCTGDTGATPLVRLDDEAPGAHCAVGGTAIHVGLDADDDGQLDDTEITQTTYACRAATGMTSLVRLETEPVGAHCATGGVAVHVGLDADASGILELLEITGTSYVCAGATGEPGAPGAPGEPGSSSLVRLDDEPAGANCEGGGVAVHAGIDGDGDGVLDDVEIDDTAYLCQPLAPTTSGILIVQPNFDPFGGTGYVSMIDRTTNDVAWTVEVPSVSVVSADPDGTSFWSAGSTLQRRSLADGAVLDTIAFPSGRDLVVAPTSNRMYVSSNAGIAVIDLVTRTRITTIPLLSGDQTLGIAISPDESELVLAIYTGNTDLAFFDTATNTVTQRLTQNNYPWDVVHLGDRVVTWSDNNEELKVFTGTPWALTTTVSVPPDGGARNIGSLQYNPVDGRLYIPQAVATNVLRFDPYAPAGYTTLPVTNTYQCTVFDDDGLGLLGMRYPANTLGFEHMALPGGARSASGIDTTGLRNAACGQALSVTF